MNDRERVRAAVRDLYREERSRGEPGALDDYKRRFPGFWDVVAEEYRALEAAAREVAPPESPATVPGPVAGGGREGPAADRIGPYRVVREIGRGGMGVVYEAEDSRLPRRVALKVLSPAFATSGPLRLRLQREAALAARLDHPNVCTVYECGEAEAGPYLAMRFVEGRTLQDWIAASREAPGTSFPGPGPAATVPPGEAPPGGAPAPAPAATAASRREGLERVLRFFEAAAGALHAAHEAGLLHRDIKPGNVMVTPAGDPVLLDFGLAREEAEGARLTQTGVLMGTPAYMSPEQLTAQHIPLDRRTDVYSLGVSLYETLTGRLPFEAPTREQLYRKILASDPVDARRWNPAVPADLQVVLEAAMDRNPDRRYGTARAFAEDLRRVRRREPIQARPAGPALRLRRWAERNPAAAAATAGLFLALSGGMAASLHLLGEARRERDEREAARREAEEERRSATEARDATARALQRARALGLASASAQAADGDPVLALHLAVEGGRKELLPAVVERLHGAVAASHERAHLPHGGPATWVDWSPSGDRVVTASEDGTAALWDPAGRRLALLEGHGGPVHAAAFSPAGDRLLTVSGDGAARLWSPDGRLLAVLRGHGGPVDSVVALPGGGWLTGSEDGTARTWGPSGEEGAVLRGHGGPVTCVAASSDGSLLATGGVDASVRTWDRQGGPRAILPQDAPVRGVAFAPGGSGLLVVTVPRAAPPPEFRHRVRVFDGQGAEVGTLEGFVNAVVDARWSPDGETIATNGAEGSVGIWTPDGTRLATFAEPTPHMQGNLAFSPDGRFLVNCGGDNALRVRERDGSVVAVLRGHRGKPLRAAFSPDGLLLASAAQDGTARIWSLFPAEVAAVLPFEGRETMRLAVSPREDRMAVVSWKRNEGRLLDLEGRPVAALRGHGAPVRTAVFDLEGRRLATGSEDGTVRLWAAADGAPGGVLPLPAKPAWCLFLPGGDRILVALLDGSALLLGDDGTTRATFPGDPGGLLTAAALHPGGEALALGDREGTVRVCGLDGSPRASWRQGSTVMDLAWSPAGDRLLSAGADGILRLTDAGGGGAAALRGHGFIATRARFSPDGSRILSASRDLTARLWVADGTPGPVLRGHRGELAWARFHPDGTRILTFALRDSVRAWDMEGRTLDEVRLPAAEMWVAVPTESARRVATVHADGTVRVWTLDPAELLGIAASRLTRPLAPEDRARFADLLGE